MASVDEAGAREAAGDPPQDIAVFAWRMHGERDDALAEVERWKRHAREASERLHRAITERDEARAEAERLLLAQGEAQRQIIDLHYDGRGGDYIKPWCSTCSDDENLVNLPCPTLVAVASAYQDDPDYRQGRTP